MNHPMVQRWLAREPGTRRGFVGQRRVRKRNANDILHEKPGPFPLGRKLL